MAQDELDAAEAGKNIGMAILSFISIITLIFYFFVKNALSVIRVSSWFFDLLDDFLGSQQFDGKQTKNEK